MNKKHLIFFVCSLLLLLWFTPAQQTEAIIGGSLVTNPSTYPWMGSISVSDVHQCGATVVDQEWILTANHCKTRYSSSWEDFKNRATVRFGSNFADSGGYTRSFIDYREYPSLDVLLLKLSSPVNITPITIISHGTMAYANVGNSGTIIGYAGNVLKQVNVPIVHTSNCDNDQSLICAGAIGVGLNASDSGGPLTVNGIQVGIAHRDGQNDDPGNGPDYFINVMDVHDWIKCSTENTGVCAFKNDNLTGNAVDLTYTVDSGVQGSSANFSTSSIFVASGWSALLTNGYGDYLCINRSFWDLDQDYYNPNPGVPISGNIAYIITYADTTCRGSDLNSDGALDGGTQSWAPQSAVIHLNGSGSPSGGSGGGSQSGSVEIFNAASYGGSKLGEYRVGTHAFTPNTLMYSFRLKDGIGSFVVTNNSGGRRCFSSSVPNMQDHSDYWHQTVKLDVYSNDICGSINGQLKVYSQANYTGSLLGAYAAENVYVFQVNTLMYSFDLDGAGSFVVTAPDGRRQCFNNDVPNMQDHSEYWRETIEIEVHSSNFCPTAGSPVSAVGSGTGLWRNQFRILWDEVDVPNLSGLAPISWGPVSNIGLTGAARDDHLGIRLEGCINLPQEDAYTFYLTSDDGSILFLADEIIVNNNGLHSAIEVANTVQRPAGEYDFKLDYYQNNGGKTLDLKISSATLPKQTIPDDWFSYGNTCSGVAPQNLVATAVDANTIGLSWDDDYGYDLGVVINVLYPGEAEYSSSLSVGEGVTTFNFSYSSCNQEISLYLTAVNSDGRKKDGGIVTVSTSGCDSLIAPTNFVCSAVGYSGIRCDWTNNQLIPYNGYIVRNNSSEWIASGVNHNYYDIQPIGCDQTYNLDVVAYQGPTRSQPSAMQVVSLACPNSIPVSGMSYASLTSTSVNIAWNPHPHASTYRVLYSYDAGNTFGQFNLGNVSSYNSWMGFSSGNTVVLKIQAQTLLGWSVMDAGSEISFVVP